MPTTNPYTAPSILNYNISPPPDDGSQTVANTISWNGNNGTAGVKAKLADPLKAYSDAINQAVAAAFLLTINTSADVGNSVAGSIGFTTSPLTIAANTVTATRSAHTIQTGGSSSAELDTITPGGTLMDGSLLILRRATPGQQITVTSGVGNIQLTGGSSIVLASNGDILVLQYIAAASGWFQIAGGGAAGAVGTTGGGNTTSASTSLYQPEPPLDYLLQQNVF